MASRDINGGVALWSSASGTQHTSELVRSFQYAVTMGLGGVFDSGDFKVTASGSNFSVATGRAMVPRTTTSQGSYFVHNTATLSSLATDTVSSGTRTDLVQLKVYDNGYSDGQTQWAIRYLPNTNAGSGDSNAIDLATLTVGTGGVTAVTDKRPLLPRPGLLVAASASTADIPVAPSAGTMAWLTGDKYLQVQNGTGWDRVNTTGSVPAPLIGEITASGSGTGYTSVSIVRGESSVDTTPYATAACPTRMVVQVHGSWGFSATGGPKKYFQIVGYDTNPTYNNQDITKVGSYWGQVVAQNPGSDITGLSVLGSRDYAKGEAMGFRCRYKNDSGGNVYIAAGVIATFHPLP